ncbi:hypothetical protein [Aquimarina agarilytica]|uniref:hypothetical protein n=1 Tax=Aquimarina agarilytica TaxID=1087449 RepID=UPI000287C446|nr:hypothetical protein [Aquimarina agarilytica]
MRRILLLLLSIATFTPISAQYRVDRSLPIGISMGYFESESDNFNQKKSEVLNQVSKTLHNYSMHPNPARIGEKVKINSLQKGDVIHIFKTQGPLVSTQVIDVDQHINTHDLTSGEYLVRSHSLFLKLLIY